MIEYTIGDTCCRISFEHFLSLTFKNEIIYKSRFDEFSDLYEFIEKNIKNITLMIFDGYKYHLEKGLLHNLYGPAVIKYDENKELYSQKIDNYFFINGKRIYYDYYKIIICKNIKNFVGNDVFFIERRTNNIKKSNITDMKYKNINGINYNLIAINLKNLIKMDQRKKKLISLNDYSKNI